MKKTAILNWNSQTLRNLKREILFFDELYYDPYLDFLHIKLLDNIAKLLNHDAKIFDEISNAQNILRNKKILKEFDFNKFKKDSRNFFNLNTETKNALLRNVSEYDSFHKNFDQTYQNAVDLLQKDYRSGFLNFLNLPTEFDKFADAHLRLSKSFLEIKNKNSIIPLVNNFEDFNEEKKSTVIRFVLDNIPTPSEDFTFDEVIDFKNDNDNKRRYYTLIKWINEISKGDLNIEEVSDEYNYLMSEFEAEFNNLKIKKDLNKFEIFLKVPFEIAENLVKINWSKIPGIFIELKRNNLTSYESEFTLSGKELAYIFKAKEKFNQ